MAVTTKRKLELKETRVFGNGITVDDIQDLTILQTRSYRNFLQADVLPNERQNIGLEALLRESFPRFLAEKGSLPKSEFQMPTEVDRLLRSGEATVRVLRTSARWYGVTSRDDRPEVAAFLATLPSPLA